jgi:hypothetical protein
MIREFDFPDLITLARYRKRGLFLDSIPTLTWGRPMVPAAALLSPFSAAFGVFTAVLQEDDGDNESIIAQVSHPIDSPFAHFTFLAPDSAVESSALTALLDYLIQTIGERGAQSLVAEVDEKSQTFEALRRANFTIYSRQRIYRVSDQPQAAKANGAARDVWRAVTPLDEFNVRKLYNLLVPAMVQQVEPAPWGDMAGWVYYEGDELLAYVDFKSGPAGVWVQPFIHPEMNDLDARLSALLAILGPRRGRPVFFCIRSHITWLGAPLQDLGGQPGAAQAVMARRLAVKVGQFEQAPLPDLGTRAEPSSPATLVQTEREPELS